MRLRIQKVNKQEKEEKNKLEEQRFDFWGTGYYNKGLNECIAHKPDDFLVCYFHEVPSQQDFDKWMKGRCNFCYAFFMAFI